MCSFPLLKINQQSKNRRLQVPIDMKGQRLLLIAEVVKVIPVYKKGSPLLVSNYRPISLLSIFNKILERLMCNGLIKYFEQSSVFFDQQFGFRSNHSTVHALILMVDKIQKAIDSKNYSCGIFIDLCKAF